MQCSKLQKFGHHVEEKKKFWLDVFCGKVPKVKRANICIKHIISQNVISFFFFSFSFHFSGEYNFISGQHFMILGH